MKKAIELLNKDVNTVESGNLIIYPMNDRKGRGFTQIDNALIVGEDKLTSDALALQITFLSLPLRAWNLNMSWLKKTIGYSMQRLRRAKLELINKGLFEEKKFRKNGKYSYEYTVFELPKHKMIELNQPIESKCLKSDDGVQPSESTRYINKNNKKENIKKNNRKNKNSISLAKSSSILNNHDTISEFNRKRKYY